MEREPGSTVVLRDKLQGQVRGMHPTVLVTQNDGDVLLYLADGTRYLRPSPASGVADKISGDWDLVERVYPARSLIASTFGDWYSVWLMWSADGEFGGWYVNFERPWTRTSDGYETKDLALDLVVDVDWRYSWKDREEFEELAAAGLISSDEAQAVLSASDAVLEMISAREGMFASHWRGWAPTHGEPYLLDGAEASDDGA